MAKGDEAKLQRLCCKYFEPTAKQFGIALGEHVSVAADVTCIKVRDSFKIVLGFAKVDLAFYVSVPFDKRHWDTTSNFRLIGVAKPRRGTINIPFLIFELKRGDGEKSGVIVDAIRSRNILARRIRDLFPFCAYVFLADSTSKTDETVLRHGKDFTNYFLFREPITRKQLSAIDSQFVRPHLEHIKYLKLLQ